MRFNVYRENKSKIMAPIMGSWTSFIPDMPWHFSLTVNHTHQQMQLEQMLAAPCSVCVEVERARSCIQFHVLWLGCDFCG